MLKDHDAVTPVRLEPVTPQSRVKTSTTEPLRSLSCPCEQNILNTRTCELTYHKESSHEIGVQMDQRLVRKYVLIY